MGPTGATDGLRRSSFDTTSTEASPLPIMFSAAAMPGQLRFFTEKPSSETYSETIVG